MPGFKSVGSSDVAVSTMFADNVNFSGGTTPTVVSDGQLLIGSSIVPHIQVSTLTAGSGISISNGHGSITISSISSSITWIDKSNSFNAAVSNGYFVTANSTANLPASPSQGNVISFVVDSSTDILTIQANVGQKIQIGSVISTSAGIAVSSSNGDSVTLVFRASDSNWLATQSMGTWSIT